MNDNDPQSNDVARIVTDALEESRDGRLDSERREAVRNLLLTSVEARRCYLQFNQLTHDLTTATKNLARHPSTELATPKADSINRTGSRRMRFVRTRLVVGVAVVAAMAVLVSFMLNARRQTAELPPIVASLEQSSGQVVLTAANETERLVNERTPLRLGDRVTTEGTLSSVELLYPDGSRFSLMGKSSLTLSTLAQKTVVLHGGTLFGSVVPQPPNHPLLVVTPQNEVRVLGTRFSVGATVNETDVTVQKGKVRLTRLHDGRSVEVPTGRRVVSTAESELQVVAIDGPPDEWSEDFESGLPEHWSQGVLVTDALPTDSKRGVRAIKVPSEWGDMYNIATQDEWAHGLFAVKEGTHLHFTFKMQNPGWCNILLITKTTEGDPPSFAGNYIFDRPDWFSAKPGEWRTVAIPLSAFRPLPPSKRGFENATPIQIVFSSPTVERGLVIDRIWVDRKGSGDIQVKGNP